MANEPVYRVTLAIENDMPIEPDEREIIVSASFRSMFELLANNGVVKRA